MGLFLNMKILEVSKSSDFQFLLPHLKLTSKLENRIASAIQRVVAAVLVDYPNPGNPHSKDGMLAENPLYGHEWFETSEGQLLI